jgi:sterol desaturase/sphingolipid hydroxylase (fatty acid hydroxylase superfamily)
VPRKQLKKTRLSICCTISLIFALLLFALQKTCNPFGLYLLSRQERKKKKKKKTTRRTRKYHMVLVLTTNSTFSVFIKVIFNEAHNQTISKHESSIQIVYLAIRQTLTCQPLTRLYIYIKEVSFLVSKQNKTVTYLKAQV